MRPIEFDGFTGTLAKDQPQYQPMPAHLSRTDGNGTLTTCWQLTPEEIIDVINTGQLWIQVQTFGHLVQPMLPMTGKRPELIP